jgi:hypothetical protein
MPDIVFGGVCSAGGMGSAILMLASASTSQTLGHLTKVPLGT